MEWVTLERKVRRLFGDDFSTVIETQDILDWANTARSEIVRETQCLPTDISIPANLFPITIPDMYLMARLEYGDPLFPRGFTTLSEVDSQVATIGGEPIGNPRQYYLRGNRVYLYPAAAPTDTKMVNLTYCRAPVELRLVDPWLTIKNSSDTYRPTIACLTELNLLTKDFGVVVDVAMDDWVGGYSFAAQMETTEKTWHFYAAGTASGVTLRTDFEENGGANFFYDAPTNIPLPPNGQRLKLGFAYNGFNTVEFFYSPNGGKSWISTGSHVQSFAGFGAVATPVVELGNAEFPNASTGAFNGIHYGIQVYVSPSSATSLPDDGSLVLDFNTERDLIPVKLDTVVSITSGTGQVVTLPASPKMLTTKRQLELPIMYHEDIFKYCMARAYEKNENYQAQEKADEAFNAGVAQRRFEEQHGDESFPFIRPDPMDWQ